MSVGACILLIGGTILSVSYVVSVINLGRIRRYNAQMPDLQNRGFLCQIAAHFGLAIGCVVTMIGAVLLALRFLRA